MALRKISTYNVTQVDTGNRATTGKVGRLYSEADIRRQKRVGCGTLGYLIPENGSFHMQCYMTIAACNVWGRADQGYAC